MLIKVDWISFTIDGSPSATHDDSALSENEPVLHTVAPYFMYLRQDLLQCDDWSLGAGRAPFSRSAHSSSLGISIFWGNVPFVLVEISGRGCDWLYDEGETEAMLERWQDRVTRLDIACDMLTDTSPFDFAEKRNLGRFKSKSHVVSETGETYYVGSRSSDRYARVYRYNEPHPRAKFLRAEHVFKAEYAKSAAKYLLENGYEAIGAEAGRLFGWSHPDYEVSLDSDNREELRAYSPDRREGNTVRWLLTSVKPAVLKLYRAGEVEAVEQFASWLADLLEYGAEGL